MQSVDENEIKKLKRLRSFNNNMPVTDTITPQNIDDCIFFPIEEIVQSPLPGYGAPTSISFSPDDTLITYLFSPDQTLNRKLFAFDLKTGKQELFFSPLDGGLDESNISPEEKLRRERSRERGLGVTQYEWVKTNSKKKAIMVPLPAGIHFQELYSSKGELKLPSSPFSPIIDPHLSPDCTMLAYVKDSELHVLNLLYNEPKQLTHGAQGNVVTHGLAEYIAQEEMDRKNEYWWSLDSKFIAFTQSFHILTGFRHLYLHDASGLCLGPITVGEWMVEQIAGVNEAAGLVYFTATLDGPLESNLYCTKLYADGSQNFLGPVRLTHGKGKHVVVLDHHMRNFVDIHDSLDFPTRVLLCSLLDGSVIMPLQMMGPLYGALYKPDPTKFGLPPYKTMINVYGGPCVQYVCDSWLNTIDMRAQYLRSKGILVWKLDNRGSARRGLKFEGALKYNAGCVDAEDQLTRAEWLIKQGLAKVGHIGLYGWSYGGYMSAMILARFPDVFRCAVSGAPMTSWDGYDTFYTEKYMGLPSQNPTGYKYSSVMHHVHKLKGKLLLVHGMIDENVHFRHTARLVNALVAAGKP
ncbi:hypothetical protein P3X46_015488 [Hevea brasiliensis]|uniref:Peptidase S9 prolyl oligopeptidase catalytic domain-containing protein n=1 Tax=Hevea brasiliensis TaxID=3981 RepID=A0ABQ9M048_HEVBR|nr:hypothetical protein P3X46_015488 [Hevea brasiliensis]